MISGVPHVFRQPLWQRLVVFIASGLVPSAVLMAGGISDGGPVLVLCAVATLPVLALSARLWVLQVVVDSDEVRVVNVFSTRCIPWSQVARFGYDNSGLWVRQRDGRQHRSTAFANTPRALPIALRENHRALIALESIRKNRLR